MSQSSMFEAGNVIARNAALGNALDYNLNGDDKLGTIQIDPSISGLWDNFQ